MIYFNQKVTSLPIRVRSISLEPRVIIGWAKQLAETFVCKVVVMQCINCISFHHMLSRSQKKRKTHSLKILSESNSRGTRIRFKNEWLESFPESLFPYDVVVDFFYNEEIQRRQRKEQEKKGRNSPARVKTPRTRTPFVRSFPASFRSSAIVLFLDTKISKTKRKQKDEWKERRIHETRVPRISANREMQFSSSSFLARAREWGKKKNARKKHLSIFSLLDTKSTNLVRFFFFVPTTKRYGKRGGRRRDLSSSSRSMI